MLLVRWSHPKELTRNRFRTADVVTEGEGLPKYWHVRCVRGKAAQRLHLGCSPHWNVETSGSLSLGSRMNGDVVTKLVGNKAVCLLCFGHWPDLDSKCKRQGLWKPRGEPLSVFDVCNYSSSPRCSKTMGLPPWLHLPSHQGSRDLSAPPPRYMIIYCSCSHLECSILRKLRRDPSFLAAPSCDALTLLLSCFPP